MMNDMGHPTALFASFFAKGHVRVTDEGASSIFRLQVVGIRQWNRMAANTALDSYSSYCSPEMVFLERSPVYPPSTASPTRVLLFPWPEMDEEADTFCAME